MKPEKKLKANNYRLFKIKLSLRLIGVFLIALAILGILYRFLWFGHGAEWIVSFFQNSFKLDNANANTLYRRMLRNNFNMIWISAVKVTFLIAFILILKWVTGYFDIINNNISSLFEEDKEIRLPDEMAATEQKLYELRAEFKQHTLEAQLAEQRKNELVMYLAHDIRTPLTSIIGYLNLLSDAPDMQNEQRAKYVGISLEKAYRLEKMINEFFEITRYNVQQIDIEKENIDLFYMLMQLSDELSPMLCAKGNTVRLDADENLTVSGDPEKLARVFNNVLKNANAYSFPDTEIVISAEEQDKAVIISFSNHGENIPKEKLSVLFEKFYRMDEARTSDKGGAGLGLAIAKEIINLHGGSITAESDNHINTFTIILPKES